MLQSEAAGITINEWNPEVEKGNLWKVSNVVHPRLFPSPISDDAIYDTSAQCSCNSNAIRTWACDAPSTLPKELLYILGWMFKSSKLGWASWSSSRFHYHLTSWISLLSPTVTDFPHLRFELDLLLLAKFLMVLNYPSDLWLCWKACQTTIKYLCVWPHRCFNDSLEVHVILYDFNPRLFSAPRGREPWIIRVICSNSIGCFSPTFSLS